MEIKRIQDKFNKNKIWIIKKYKCGHYYLNQEIYGISYYHGFQRVTKKYLKQILGE